MMGWGRYNCSLLNQLGSSGIGYGQPSGCHGMPDGIELFWAGSILRLAAAVLTRIGNAPAETQAESKGSLRFSGLKRRGPLHILRAA
jgi:hypothetical protein